MPVVVTFNWKSNVDKRKSVALSKSTSIDDCCVSMANFAEFAFTSIMVFLSTNSRHAAWVQIDIKEQAISKRYQSRDTPRVHAGLQNDVRVTRLLCHNQHFSIFAKAGSQAGHYCNRLPCMDIQYIECPCMAFGCSRCSHAHMPTTRRYSCDLLSASLVPDCPQPTHNDSIATT